MSRGCQILRALCVIASIAASGAANASTMYKVRIILAKSTMDSLNLEFDLTSSDRVGNRLTLTNLRHDGHVREADATGGPLSGKVMGALTTEDTLTLDNEYVTSQAVLPIDRPGSFIGFDVQFSEQPRASLVAADALAFYVTDGASHEALGSADGLGTDALFVVTATGAPGGELEVFAPMTFIPPDSLVLRVKAERGPTAPVKGRLWILDLHPSPKPGEFNLRYHVPAPGGKVVLRVYDDAGRLVNELHRRRQEPGTYETTWDGKERNGQTVAPGVYLARLDLEDVQTVVRRFVVAK